MAERLKERKEKKEREREREQGTNDWMKIELIKKSASKHAYCFYEAVFGCRNPLLTPPTPRILGRGLVETAGLFNLAQMMVCKLEYKLEKLKYKKLQIMQLMIKNKCQLWTIPD